MYVSICALGFSIYSGINFSLLTLSCMQRFFDVFSSNLINNPPPSIFRQLMYTQRQLTLTLISFYDA
jgi:hypothetical protein